ncbi:MAG: cyclic pyranopterin monophosphate synthase MoaC [Alphaproteobacteria bacterium]|nr:cyclic pyranopterin monophosphate synthase MoaC [Alphaproteobacteria bacterium]
MSKLTHVDETGAARMVDVGDKASTHRIAIAEAFVHMRTDTLGLILDGKLPKGDVLAAARLAGIMAAKKTSDLIPLCHPLPITSAKLDITKSSDTSLRIEAYVKVNGQTGVEMEALTAASVASLTIYDMAKASDKAMRIDGVRLLRKEGGKSGTYEAD